jgi:hypothetical protein
LLTTILAASGATGVALAHASSWTVEPSPTPAGHGANLSGVSCRTAASCLAVGTSFTPSFAQVPLAEHRRAGGWSITPTPLPAGASGAKLDGVSCHGRNCTAVGTSYGSDSNPVTSKVLIERWNGTSWQIQSAPTPAGPGSSELGAVSCVTASSCKAVGTAEAQFGQPVALSESFNGHRWAIDPKPPQASDLTGVSCTSSGACTAVGWVQTSDGQGTIAERWNGRAWGVQTTPALGHFNNTNVLLAVSCPAALYCAAVGYTGVSGHGLVTSTLAEAWPGRAWSTQPTFTNGISALSGVSCARPDTCTAVGQDEALPNGGTTIQRWNGRAWAVQQSPLDNSPATLSAVSCPTLRSCTAVGSSATGGTLVERYAGS